MVKLEGGTFTMGSNDGFPHQKPTHPVTLKPFSMDVTEVTVAAYEACVDAGSCSTLDLNEYDPCNWGKSDRGNHPINCVDWEQATSFCRWANKRLPTEEEWEYGALQGGAWGIGSIPGATRCRRTSCAGAIWSTTAQLVRSAVIPRATHQWASRTWQET
jgi:formylglycine-generating enzyme required for sulfatase activity